VSTPDLQKLLEQARGVQERLVNLQRELAGRTVEGSAGGGLVTAVATGALRIMRVEVDPSLVEGGDRDLLQDLVAAACNAALENAQRLVQEEMQRAAGGLPLPGSAAGPTGPIGFGGPGSSGG